MMRLYVSGCRFDRVTMQDVLRLQAVSTQLLVGPPSEARLPLSIFFLQAIGYQTKPYMGVLPLNIF